MDGYNLNLVEIKQQINHFGELIADLTESIERMRQIEDELLNDAVWRGPNKTLFRNNFMNYLTNATNIRNSSDNHHQSLINIMNTYQSAEKG